MSSDLSLVEETLHLIELFVIAGSTTFDVTYLSIVPLDKKSKPTKHRNLTGVLADELRRKLPGWIADADKDQESVAIRPHGWEQKLLLVQLDDIGEYFVPKDEARAEEVRRILQPLAFFELQTSPGSRQFWFAIHSEGKDSDESFVRFLKKATGSNSPASGSTRAAGCRNFKEEHRTPDGFPLIRIPSALGNIVTREQLVNVLGIVPEPIKEVVTYTSTFSTHRSVTSNSSSVWRVWPEEDECRRHGEQRGDRDLGDYRFALIAYWRGFDKFEIADKLMGISKKAEEHHNPRHYCERKAEDAAEFANQHPEKFSKPPRAPQDGPKSFNRPILPSSPETSLPERSRVGSEVVVEVAFPPKSRPSVAPSLKESPSGIFATQGASKSKVLAFVSTREDALAVHAAVGIPAVVLGTGFPSDMRRRTASKRVYLATRQGDDALLRRLCEVLTLCSGVERIRWPQEALDEQTLLDTLRALFASHQRARREPPTASVVTDVLDVVSNLSTPSVEVKPDGLSLLDYAEAKLGCHPD